MSHTSEFGGFGLVAITTSLFSLIIAERTMGSASMAAKTSLCNQPNRSTSLLSGSMHRLGLKRNQIHLLNEQTPTATFNLIGQTVN